MYKYRDIDRNVLEITEGGFTGTVFQLHAMEIEDGFLNVDYTFDFTYVDGINRKFSSIETEEFNRFLGDFLIKALEYTVNESRT